MTELTPPDFDALLTTDTAFVIKYWAPWCDACTEIDPLINSVAASAATPFYSVDIEQYPEIKMKARIKSIPLLLFYKNGHARSVLIGNNITEEKITQRLRMLGEV